MEEPDFIPDLFVIGAMKAGTSTLWKGFANDEVLSPSKNKELNYFLRDYDKQELSGLYRVQFQPGEVIKIDISPNYSRKHIYKGVPLRIYKAKPEAKILYLVRNPVDRIISHLHHDLFRDRINPEDIDKAVFANDDYINTSRYYYQIEDYLNLFGREKILILPIELLKKDRPAFLNQISTFLNLEDFQFPDRSYNVSEKRYWIKNHDTIHHHLKNPFLLKLYHYFWYFINVKIERPELSYASINKIKEMLAGDKEKMMATFGEEIGKWI